MASLRLSFKRILSNKSSWFFIGLFFLLFIFDTFLLRNSFGFIENHYIYPHAMQVFLMRMDSGFAINSIFLPLIFIGLTGSYVLNNRLSGLDNLACIRCNRLKVLNRSLFNTSVIIGFLVACLFIISLIFSFVLYPSDPDLLKSISHVDDLLYLNSVSIGMYTFLMIMVNVLAAIGYNLTAQAIGLLATSRPIYYVLVFTVVLIVPYLLYFSIPAPLISYIGFTPLIMLIEPLYRLTIFETIGYWILHLILNLLIIYTIFYFKERRA